MVCPMPCFWFVLDCVRKNVVPSHRLNPRSIYCSFLKTEYKNTPYNTRTTKIKYRQLTVFYGGVFWTKFEHFLSKTPNKEASPTVARKPRHPAKKFSSHFLICARRFFSSKRKRKLLCGVLLLTSRTAGLSVFCIRSGVAEFPPNPPSATPSRGRFFFSAEFEAVYTYFTYLP